MRAIVHRLIIFPHALFPLATAISSVLCLLAPLYATGAHAAPREVGVTVSVKRRPTGTLGEKKRRLRKGTRVFRDELLETGRRGQAEFKLDDQTKLALGPSARLKLDEFVVPEAASGATAISLNFVRGTFRFITGLMKSDSYKIVTPSATMGIRGTVFDVYVDRRGDTLVLLHEGEVEICSRAGTCRRHNSVGRIIHTTVAGVISAPIKFAASLIPGVSVARAFPFVGRRLVVDPIRRLRRADIVVKSATKPVRRAGKALKRGTRTIRRTIRKISPF